MTTIASWTITSAGTVNGTPFRVQKRNGIRGLTAQCAFTYGSGGTSVDVKIQTSIDGGANWVDIWHATQFTTASGRRAVALPMTTATSSTADIDATAALTAGHSQDGYLGDQIRATYTSVGTYAGGTTVAVDVYSEQMSSTANDP